MVRFNVRFYLIYPAWLADFLLFTAMPLYHVRSIKHTSSISGDPGQLLLCLISSGFYGCFPSVRAWTREERREGGMQQWQSRDLSHSTGGLCKGFWSQYARLDGDMKRPAEVRADPDHRYNLTAAGSSPSTVVY